MRKNKTKFAKRPPHAGDKDVEAIVDGAVLRMADAVESQVWFEKPEQPGLHMMRYRRGQAFNYHAVRVIFCDDGNGLEWTATYIPGSTSVALNDFNEVSFQKVKE